MRLLQYVWLGCDDDIHTYVCMYKSKLASIVRYYTCSEYGKIGK